MKPILHRSILLFHLAAFSATLPDLEAAENVVSALEEAGAPAYKTGESWIYRASEKRYGSSSSNSASGEFEVTFEKGLRKIYRLHGSARTEGNIPGIWTLMLPTRPIRQSPAQYFQFPLTVGKSWKANYFAPLWENWITPEYIVAGVETVATPAGTFPAFRIERRLKVSYYGCGICEHINYKVTDVYFYSPRTRSVLKYHIRTERRISGGGDADLDYTLDVELMKFSSADVAPPSKAKQAQDADSDQ